MRLRIGIALFIQLAFVAATRTSDACSCDPSYGFDQQVANAAVIFRGRVISNEPLGGPFANLDPRIVKLCVLDSWKGVTSSVTEIVATAGTSCKQTFTVGDEWLVFARPSPLDPTRPTSGYCDGGGRLPFVDSTITALGPPTTVNASCITAPDAGFEDAGIDAMPDGDAIDSGTPTTDSGSEPSQSEPTLEAEGEGEDRDPTITPPHQGGDCSVYTGPTSTTAVLGLGTLGVLAIAIRRKRRKSQ